MKHLLILCFLVILFMLSGCSSGVKVSDNTAGDSGVKDSTEETTEANTAVEVPEFSTEYLVGFNFGGEGWGTIFDVLDAEIVICNNHDVLVYMPTKVEGKETSDEQVIATFTLTDDQYSAIDKELDKELLYTLDPEPDDGVEDGKCLYLILYDKENTPIYCGSYEPTNDDWCRMRKAVIDNVPLDDIIAARQKQVDKLNDMAED